MEIAYIVHASPIRHIIATETLINKINIITVMMYDKVR